MAVLKQTLRKNTPCTGRGNGIRPPAIGYRSLSSFLVRRKAPKHRKHIQPLLEQYGCNDLEGFLQVTCALSLNDTFWVRKAGSPVYLRGGGAGESQLAAPEWYLQKCKPRLGTDFLLTARGLLTDSIRRDLKRLGSFSFRQHPRIRAEQERLDSLSKIVQNQIHQILST